MTRLRCVAAPLAAFALLLSACSQDTAGDAPGRALPATFDDGVPAPTQDVVLSIDVDGETVDWDLPTLGMLEQQDLTIVEPFLDEEHTYTGPLWSDVLRASGVDLDAEPLVELVALDDYVADIETDPTTLDGLLLAHLEDDAPIEVADGGPIRLIFPLDNPAAENLNNWIWSIRAAEVP